MPELELLLFGYPRILRAGRPLQLERRRTLALLAYLALNGPCARDALTTFFWPDSPPEQAAAYLRHALWEIGKILGDACLDRAGALVGLRLEAIRCDALEFERLLAETRRGSPNAGFQAAGLQQEAFLKGFTLKDSYEFDDWQAGRTEGYRLQLAEILDALAAVEAQQDRPESALPHARRRLALDPLDEAAHRQLMRLLDQSGQRTAALRQYETCRQILHDQLGVPPEAETIALQRRIQAAQAQEPGRPAFSPAFTRPPVPVFLPAQPTPFVGRSTELAEIHATLERPDCRLLVLIGPGGCGKTRLAIQAAASLPPAGFPDGIYYCGLAGVADPQQIPERLAEALHLQIQRTVLNTLPPAEVLEQIRLSLVDKTILLILDSLEQLAEHGPLFLSLLDGAPGVKFLATSRDRLNLPGEWVIEVAGLALPERMEADDPQANPAVDLFLKGALRSGCYKYAAADFPAILQICRLVDGMPLGIELASSWVRMFSCAEIAAEIERDFGFLDTAAAGKNGPRSAFEHSWRLLPPPLQEIFARLAVFQHGFTREAALAVAGASLHHLAALSDRSLIRRVSSGRYDLHELLKQYAAEKLAFSSAARAQTLDRHSRFFLEWIPAKGELLKGPRQLHAVAEFQLEMPNLRAAWARAVEQRELTALTQAVPMFLLFHDMHGVKPDGLQMIEHLTPLLEPGQPRFAAARALVLAARRHLALGYRDLSPDQPDQLESLSLAQSLPDTQEKAYILLLHGIGPAGLRDARSVAVARQSRAIFEQCGDRWGAALATLVAADSSFFSHLDPDLSRQDYTQALAEFAAMENTWGKMLATNGLGYIALAENRLAEAAAFFSEALSAILLFGDAHRMVETRQILAGIFTRLAQPARAAEFLRANQEYYIHSGRKCIADQIELEIAALPSAP